MNFASDKIIRGEKISIKNESFAKLILNSLQTYTNTTAMVDVIRGESVTFNQLLNKTISLAQHLKMYGVKRNDVIAIISENSINFSISTIAAFYSGVITAPISPLYTEREIIHAINISKPKIIFCSELVIEKILNITPQLQFVEKIILLNITNRNIPKSVIKLEDLLNLPPIKYFDVTPTEPDQVVAILCSSGTTGLPKGVMITDKMLLGTLDLLEYPTYGNLSNKNIMLLLIPFFHIYGYMCNINMIIIGMKQIILAKFEENLFLKTMQDYNVTTCPLVPPLLLFLSKSPLVSKYDLSKFKDCLCGAAPLTKEMQESVMKRLNINIRQGYGCTECPAVSLVPYNTVKYNSVGKIAPGMECKVVDMKSGEALGPNKEGELCFRGVQVMKGYVRDPKATAAAIDEDGWLHTGDVGYYDEEEYVYIVDRYKELIKYKGYQVPPTEIEGILLSHPEVLDCAVIGKPDEEAGELPTAFIVRKPNAKITAKEICNFVAQNVSVHKRLHGGVRFVEAIPKNPTGKILKRILREQLIQSKSKL